MKILLTKEEIQELEWRSQLPYTLSSGRSLNEIGFKMIANGWIKFENRTAYITFKGLWLLFLYKKKLL